MHSHLFSAVLLVAFAVKADFTQGRYPHEARHFAPRSIFQFPHSLGVTLACEASGGLCGTAMGLPPNFVSLWNCPLHRSRNASTGLHQNRKRRIAALQNPGGVRRYEKKV
jgi:hypothetical protein